MFHKIILFFMIWWSTLSLKVNPHHQFNPTQPFRLSLPSWNKIVAYSNRSGGKMIVKARNAASIDLFRYNKLKEINGQIHIDEHGGILYGDVNELKSDGITAPLTPYLTDIDDSLSYESEIVENTEHPGYYQMKIRYTMKLKGTLLAEGVLCYHPDAKIMLFVTPQMSSGESWEYCNFGVANA